MKARPTKMKLRNMSEQTAKRLALVLGAVLLVLILVIALFPLLDSVGKPYEVTTYAMGSYVQQSVYGDNSEEAAVAAADAIQALENEISWRVSGSDVQKLNNAAGKDWVELNSDTMEILEIAQDVAERSGGAFDVTIAPISRLWDFDSERQEVPDIDTIDALLPNVGYEFLRLDTEENTASLKNLDNAVDLGGVGKGAACDAAIEAYAETGAEAAIVSVGGSVGVWGQKDSGADWSIAVRDPNSDGALGALSIESGFLATSGSVTVLCDNGARADALATACFVLGLEEGQALLESYDAEGIFISTDNVITVTDGLQDRFTLTADGYTIAE